MVVPLTIGQVDGISAGHIRHSHFLDNIDLDTPLKDNPYDMS